MCRLGSHYLLSHNAVIMHNWAETIGNWGLGCQDFVSLPHDPRRPVHSHAPPLQPTILTVQCPSLPPHPIFQPLHRKLRGSEEIALLQPGCNP